MQKVIYTKDYKGHKKGSVAVVSVNVAHGLFEAGVAVAYSLRAERGFRKEQKIDNKRDKMMRAKKQEVSGLEDPKGRYTVK